MTTLALFLTGMAAAIPLALLGDYVMSILADETRPLPRLFHWDTGAIAAAFMVVVLVLGTAQQSDERAAERAIATANGRTTR